MKLTNLSLSIMIALGVAACGGSDGGNNDNTPAPTDPPKPDTTPTPPAPTPDTSNKDDKIVDPTGTKVVDGRDLTKESTVGGLQYIRREASDYDRVFNPAKPASATPLLGVSLNEQNPKLTNIVLARRDLEREEDKAVRAQFAGGLETEPLTLEGKPQEKVSLQAENFKNVDILAGAFKQVGSAKFGDTDDRLDPVTHDINTHIQNNVDKDREFTRERVEFVYTPRYEYKQPFVDYPNAADPDNNTKEAPDGDHTTIATRAPLPPTLGDIDSLQTNLINYRTWHKDNENDNSRHPVNIGTGKDGASGAFHNNEQLYGNFNPANPPSGHADIGDPANNANANRWRNIGVYDGNGAIRSPSPSFPAGNTDPEGNRYTGKEPTDGVDNGLEPKRDNVVDWTKAYTGTPSRGSNYAYRGSTAPTLPTGYTHYDVNLTQYQYNYQQAYAKGAYPQYPKEMFGYPYKRYDEAGNNALNGADGDTDPLNHEHIYLEREKFTSIREPKSIRPLVNPVAHEWDWKLAQGWDSTYRVTWTTTHTSFGGGTYTINRYKDISIYDYGQDGDIYKDTILDRVGTNASSYCDAHGGTVSNCIYASHTGSSLRWAYWHDPVNQGGGQKGEFRGPAYTGWDQDNRTIQFADTRIWKPGTPGYRPEYERKYGANLIWWSTQDSAFENWATSKGLNPRARRVDRNTDSNSGVVGEGMENLVWGSEDPMTATGTEARDRDVEIQPTGDITNGLIRVGGDRYSHTGKMPTLGQELIWKDGRWEDHHKTTTRIFGHYHLAWADQEDDRKVKAMSLNSYSGARSFVAKVKDSVPNAQSAYKSPWGAVPNLDSEPEKYSIGAEPMTLQKVQYGRVTSNLDLVSGEGPLGDGFLRAPFAKKGEGDSVDNYFFRGVDATTIEQMAALPQEGTVKYVGHALMYGINNDFHGMTGDTHAVEPNKNLPNAFNGLGRAPAGGGGMATIGLGNFVEADVDFGAHKVKGDVYNAWLVDDTKPGVVHDKLVSFEGDITGNTVLGKADRAYDPGNDNAEFRAAFFGSMADEMGGAFNSVASEDKYGSAYETGDWGGVFGAKKLGSANTFQGDDGANVYGN